MIPRHGASILLMQLHSKRYLDKDAGKTLVYILLQNGKNIQFCTVLDRNKVNLIIQGAFIKYVNVVSPFISVCFWFTVYSENCLWN